MRKNLIAALSATLAICTFSTNAQALLLEPVAGYHLGTYKDNSGVGASSDDSLNGIGFGARVGTELAMLFVAADFNYGKVTLAAASGDRDATRMSLGLTAGADVAMFRLWGGLNFINEVEDDLNGNSIKGMGFKVGAGYSIIPLLSLNVEYFISPGNESCDSAGTCTDIPNDVSFNSWFISLSAPLSL